jgi:hypothetical protein
VGWSSASLRFRFERGYLGASPVDGWQELNRNARTGSEEVEVDDVVVMATPYDAALGIFLQMALQENLRNSRPYS